MINIQDITDPSNPISVDGNATLQVNMTDMGEPGSSDGIAITVWNKSGGLWYSSDWNGSSTAELTLAGGNLLIRGGATVTADASTVTKSSKEITTLEPLESKFYNYPNSFSDKTTIAFMLAKEDQYSLEVYDLNGKLVKKLTSGTAEAGNLYEYKMDTSELAPGIFITRLITPTQVFNLRMIKTY